MKVSLTIYLLRKSFSSIEAVENACSLSGYKLIETNSEVLVGIAKCFAKSSPPTQPRWVGFYREAFDIPQDMLFTRSSSLIVFLSASGRIFAITSGHAHHAVPRDIVENDFGLRATLNAIGPETLRSLQSRTIDPLTVQRLEVSNRNTSLQSFVLDQERELIAKLEGVPENKTDGMGIAGSNSVQVNREATCNDLPHICTRLLSLSRQRRYKSNFGFIDQIKVVQNQDYIAALDFMAAAAIRDRGKKSSIVSLAIPSIENYTQIDSYRAKMGNRELGELGDLDIDSLFDIVENMSEDDDLMGSVRLVAEDVDGRVVERGILRDWLVAEVEWKKAKYVLTGGAWYRVAKDYADEVNALIDGIHTIKSRGYLPSMFSWGDQVESESDYNLRCVSGTCLCLDQNTIQMDRWGKVEVCDLLTSSRHLIHVKKQVSSGTLSHLWGQGVVSAQLLSESRLFRAKVRKKLGNSAELIPLEFFDTKQFSVVYAIATASDNFPQSLPFFSKVNLLHHRARLLRLGFKVKLRKIGYENR